MKKRICFVASNPFNPDPRAEKQMITLEKNGYIVSGIGWDRNSSQEYAFNINERICIHEIGIISEFGSGIKNLIPLLKFNIALFFKLISKRKKFDIIQSVNLDTGLTCLIFAKLFHKKIVYDIYDYYVDAFPVPKKLKKVVRRIENSVINNSDLIILPIDSRKKQIKGSKPKKIIIIYNTPGNISNLDTGLVTENYRQNKINIAFVGALVPDRFLYELIDIVYGRNDLFLHIAGFGSESIVNYIKKYSGNKIKFYGKVKYEDGLAISSISDVMIAMYNPIIPNHKYSAPNKFYEALFLGKPIVVANGTGIDELVRKYNVGYSVDYDIEALNALFSGIKKEDLSKFSDERKQLYKDTFSWKQMELKLLEAYKQLGE